MLRRSLEKPKLITLKSIESSEDNQKKDIFPKSKSKIESSVSENIPLKTFKVVQSNKEINENQHSTTNFEDSLNYGSEEDNIINDKKYKESKIAKYRQPSLAKAQKRKIPHQDGEIFSDLDSPYQGDDKFELDIEAITEDDFFPRGSPKKGSFKTLDKNLIFGEQSPNRNKFTSTDEEFSSQGKLSSSGILFDFVDSNSLKKFTIIESGTVNENKRSLKSEKKLPNKDEKIIDPVKKDLIKESNNYDENFDIPSPKGEGDDICTNHLVIDLDNESVISDSKKKIAKIKEEPQINEKKESENTLENKTNSNPNDAEDSEKHSKVEEEVLSKSVDKSSDKSVEGLGPFYDCEIDLRDDVKKSKRETNEDDLNKKLEEDEALTLINQPNQKTRFKILTINRSKTGKGCTITLKKITLENSVPKPKIINEIKDMNLDPLLYSEFPRRSLREKREKNKDFEGTEYG